MCMSFKILTGLARKTTPNLSMSYLKTKRKIETHKHIGEFLWNNPEGENYTLAFCASRF